MRKRLTVDTKADTKRAASVAPAGSSQEADEAEAPASPYPHFQIGTPFAVRCSRFDQLVEKSAISQSQFWGFANLFLLSCVYYLFTNPLIRLYDRGDLFDPSLARMMFDDFFFVMFMWLKLFLWAFLAHFMLLGYFRGYYPLAVLRVLQHTAQGMCIGYAITMSIVKDWPMVPTAFCTMVSVTHFMKMHSYIETNLRYAELKGTQQECPDFPDNVTLRNFAHYMMCPVLVYEPKYPEGPGFRLSYFLLKIVSMAGIMAVLYLLITTYIIPVVMQSDKLPFFETIVKLIFPFLYAVILFFFLLFECLLNIFAEVVNFGDREFYHDWWNSTSWDEFARKWNRPVHEFLLRHVYLESRYRHKFNKGWAAATTFLFSALLHEMILAVCFRFIRLYMFGLMLLQIPLIALGRFHKGKQLGNWIVWGGLLFGVPLLATCYSREWRRLDASGAAHTRLY